MGSRESSEQHRPAAGGYVRKDSDEIVLELMDSATTDKRFHGALAEIFEAQGRGDAAADRARMWDVADRGMRMPEVLDPIRETYVETARAMERALQQAREAVVDRIHGRISQPELRASLKAAEHLAETVRVLGHELMAMDKRSPQRSIALEVVGKEPASSPVR